jgi:hypothetical protein
MSPQNYKIILKFYAFYMISLPKFTNISKFYTFFQLCPSHTLMSSLVPPLPFVVKVIQS